MVTYRYVVTVEAEEHVTSDTGRRIADEIDSNLESVIDVLGIEHFTVECMPVYYWPGRGFVESSLAPLSPDGRYQS